MPFALCVACRRHVRSAEARCPFCSAATITALVAGVALASCATDRGPANVYGGPPPEPMPLFMIDAGSGADDDASPPDASAAATPDAGATTTNPQRGGDVYGGPPPKR